MSFSVKLQTQVILSSLNIKEVTIFFGRDYFNFAREYNHGANNAKNLQHQSVCATPTDIRPYSTTMGQR